MSLAPAERQGSASGVFNTINSLGLALGVCFFEMIMSRPSALQPRSLTGYRDAYIFGGIVCIVAFFFSLLVNHRGKRTMTNDQIPMTKETNNTQ